MRAQRVVCHLRRLARAPEPVAATRAWHPRVQPRIPRFRWKAQLKCRRRCVFARSPGSKIVMRRPFCRAHRRIAFARAA